MLFVKGFYQFQSGHIEDAWINVNLIKSVKETSYYDNACGKQVGPVLKLDMGVESSDKVPYVNLSRPLETRSFTDLFGSAVAPTPIPNRPPLNPVAKRGRPPKNKQ